MPNFNTNVARRGSPSFSVLAREWGDECYHTTSGEVCGKPAEFIERGETDSFGSEWNPICRDHYDQRNQSLDAMIEAAEAAYGRWEADPEGFDVEAYLNTAPYELRDCEWHKVRTEGPQTSPAAPRRSCDSGDVYHLCDSCEHEKNTDWDDLDDWDDDYDDDAPAALKPRVDW